MITQERVLALVTALVLLGIAFIVWAADNPLPWEG